MGLLCPPDLELLGGRDQVWSPRAPGLSGLAHNRPQRQSPPPPGPAVGLPSLSSPPPSCGSFFSFQPHPARFTPSHQSVLPRATASHELFLGMPAGGTSEQQWEEGFGAQRRKSWLGWCSPNTASSACRNTFRQGQVDGYQKNSLAEFPAKENTPWLSSQADHRMKTETGKHSL